MSNFQTALFRFFYSYKRLDNNVLLLITAAFFLHMINSVFFLILNLYLSKEGFSDPKIADFVSFRFLAVMMLAFPLGFMLRGRRLKPYFYAGSVLVPASSLCIIFSVPYEQEFIIYTGMICWGIGFTCMQITILPYILRNARQSMHTEAISLNFASWSISMLTTGIVTSILINLNPVIFSEQVILTFFGFLGFTALFQIWLIDSNEHVPRSEYKAFDLKSYDWKLITRALAPTLIIAVGAGMTIPFINLFFFHVYGIDSSKFAIMGTVTAFLVALAAITVPLVKKRLGYKRAIPVSQSSAVVLLIILASTEYYSHMQFAMWLAIGCFLIRQPLMNMAGPMTSELTMYYVGRKNQEIISAMTSTIWSGSWFISSQIFRILREQEWSFSSIFYVTSAIYAAGVIWYYFLIRDYNRRLEERTLHK